MLFYVFILTQVSFVCRISELSLADELLKTQSCTELYPKWFHRQACVAERLHAFSCHRMLFEEAEEELCLSFHYCNQCFVAPLPHKQKQLWIGPICLTRVFPLTSAPQYYLLSSS